MFCVKCGSKLDDDALFCDECGARVRETTQPAAGFNQPEQRTGEPSPAMASINNIYNGAKAYVNKSGLDGWQIACCILSAFSVIFSLITYNYIYNWITAICSTFLVFLCVKKEKPNTVLFALPFTVYFGKELIFWLIRKAPYLSGFNMLLGLTFFIIDIAAVVCYWLLVTNKIAQKKITVWIILGTLGINTIGILFNFLGGYLGYFRNILYYLSMLFFLAVYIIAILREEIITGVPGYTAPASNVLNTYPAQSNTQISGTLQSYAQLGGFLKLIVIMYKYIIPVLVGIIVISSSITFIKTIRAVISISAYGYYDASGDIAKSVVLMLVAVAIAVFAIIIFIKLANKIENRKPDFFRFFQILYIIGSVFLIISAIVSGGNVIANVIIYLVEEVIVFLLWNTYFTKSVRVAVYMGSDEYLRKSIFNKNTRSPLSK